MYSCRWCTGVVRKSESPAHACMSEFRMHERIQDAEGFHQAPPGGATATLTTDDTARWMAGAGRAGAAGCTAVYN
jgi:hypothetical protein